MKNSWVLTKYNLVFLAVFTFFILVQITFAQPDYRNFTIYDSKHFSIMYPRSWTVVNNSDSDSQFEAIRFIIANTIPRNQSVIIDNLTKVDVSLIPSRMVTVDSNQTFEIETLDSWINNHYSPVSQRDYGMYDVKDSQSILSGIPARTISYKVDHNCTNKLVPMYYTTTYAFDHEMYLTISSSEPVSNVSSVLPELETIIKSFNIKINYDNYLSTLLPKIKAGTAGLKEMDSFFLEDKTGKYIAMLNEDNKTNGTALAGHMSIPYLSSQPRC